MEKSKHKKRIEEWLYEQIGKGVFSFSIEQLMAEFPAITRRSVIVALARLAKKGKIISIKDLYIIIYPQYQCRGIIPPSYFIDKLMEHLKRPYYVGLLNAAEFHGAAHQKPQEFYVFTNRPPLRPLLKKGVQVNFISINTIRFNLLQERKTPFGYFKLSSPILTALDLVEYGHHIGGLNRVATILAELSEELKESDFTISLVKSAPLPVLQRLGYILDSVVSKPELADKLLAALKEAAIKLRKIKLDSPGEEDGFRVNAKWNMVVNYEIEIDE